MLAHDHGDALITGATRKSAHVLGLINHVFDAGPEDGAVGVTALLHKGRIVLIADTLVQEWPNEEDLATIAIRAAEVARMLGLEPRVAFVSFSTFGYPRSERSRKRCIEAPRGAGPHVGVDFEYEGEMAVDVALNTAGSGAISVPTSVRAREYSCGAGAAFRFDFGEADAGDGGRDR
jgi:malate dehydrogenase (oxaloacetate-decarboxylating)(NADP+)